MIEYRVEVGSCSFKAYQEHLHKIVGIDSTKYQGLNIYEIFEKREGSEWYQPSRLKIEIGTREESVAKKIYTMFDIIEENIEEMPKSKFWDFVFIINNDVWEKLFPEHTHNKEE